MRASDGKDEFQAASDAAKAFVPDRNLLAATRKFEPGNKEWLVN
jgi:hypothetical protein